MFTIFVLILHQERRTMFTGDLWHERNVFFAAKLKRFINPVVATMTAKIIRINRSEITTSQFVDF